MSLLLRACGMGKQLVKVWRKVEEGDAIELLFEDVNHMAGALGVGIQFSRVSLTSQGGVMIIVLSPSSWVELWERKIEGAVFFLGSRLLKAFHYDLSDEVVAVEAGESSQQQGKVDKSSCDKGQKDSQATRVPFESSPCPSNIPTSSNPPLIAHVEEKLPHLQSGGGSLEVIIMAGSEPGSGIRECGLRLAPLKENRCCLSTTLRLIFSMQVQPKVLSMYDQKILEVDVSSVYELPCESIVQEEKDNHTQGQGHEGGSNQAQSISTQAEPSNEEGCTSTTRLGIVHDSLSASFKCCTPGGAALWTSQKLGVTSLDVSEKLQTARSKAREAGLNIGGMAGHPGAGTFQIMGNLKHTKQSMHVKEHTTVKQVDAIDGTDFYIIDKCQRRPTSYDILSYEAAHKPSLGLLTSLEEVGVSMQKGEPIDSAVGQTTTLQFSGKFVLDEKGLHKHELLIRRRLGEMLVVEHKEKNMLKRFQNKDEKSWFKRLTRQKIKSSEIELGEQEYKLAFFINHEFDLHLYEGGRLLRKVRHLMDLAIADIISPAEEQQQEVENEKEQQQFEVEQEQQAAGVASCRSDKPREQQQVEFEQEQQTTEEQQAAGVASRRSSKLLKID